MKRKIYLLISALITIGFLFTACDKQSDPYSLSQEIQPIDFGIPIGEIDLNEVQPGGCGTLYTTDLIAGKHFDNVVGSVKVNLDPDIPGNLLIVYEINNDNLGKWAISETHLSVTNSLDAVPGYPGNPKIGNFEYKGYHPNVNTVSYSVEIPDQLTDGQVVILAHAVVEDLANCMPDFEAFSLLIPDVIADAHYESGADGTGGSYFSIDITNGANLDGENYAGWCIDLNHGISIPIDSKVKFISSLNPNFATLVEGLIDIPANIAAVNWILNQDFVGKTLPDHGVFTRGDVQTAIWRLLELTIHTHWLADEYRYNWILEEAKKHTDFIPGCGDLVGIVLLPVDEFGIFNGIQPSLITIPMPCECGDETAWAVGNPFTGDSWAMYFEFCAY